MLRHAFEHLEGDKILWHIVCPPPPVPPIFSLFLSNHCSNSLSIRQRSKDLKHLILGNTATQITGLASIGSTWRPSQSLSYFVFPISFLAKTKNRKNLKNGRVILSTCSHFKGRSRTAGNSWHCHKSADYSRFFVSRCTDHPHWRFQEITFLCCLF